MTATRAINPNGKTTDAGESKTTDIQSPNPDHQRLEALVLANAARTRHAQLKIGIACGSIDPLKILSERSESIRIYDVLRSISGVSHVKASKILKASGISDKTMRVDYLCGQRHTELVSQTMQAIRCLEEGRKVRAANG